MIQLFALHIDPILTDKQLTHLLSFVDRAKREKIVRYHRRIDAKRSLLADLLIRMQIAKRFEVDPRELQFAYNQYGKPYLQGHPQVHFNLSHAGEWVVGMLGCEEIGVDVECIKELDHRITDVVFSEAEMALYQELPENRRQHYFYKIWTAKESYVKAVGKGLSISPQSITVCMEEHQSYIVGKKKQIRHYTWVPDYVLCACVERVELPTDIIYVEENAIYGYYEVL
ncbi:4'-phosphopantetheinyl transferase superfamily protein [Hazenella sp. IB182357]|uniref:4'-phosphopantetheinyl transferase superfamily protein n=1 Tax=Polycladospora coralii TaxID=2771432 RepID=A0A926RUN1_9BACL|nr:4'-phosphopantetheinyl transferase superfamily protein [Polycladospora coralii]MBD1372569.1 4'-phosphopantetheinyl transferase superfamily protein [Polycladospora coralii]MBS7531308.1 4'-phosphopantetheinyl transferase superfamily protein [Polycladospora coralii]